MLAKSLSEEDIAHRKDLLVQTASRILEEEGMMALTLRRLATEANVSRTTPYLYFKDKQALLEEICVTTFNAMTTNLVKETSQCESYIDQMTASGRAYLKFAIAHPVLYHLTFATENPEDEVKPSIQAAADAYKDVALKPMRQAYEAGFLAIEPERLNMVLWASLHGLLSLRWAGHLSDEAAFKQVEEDMSNVLALGLFNRKKLEELKILPTDM